MLLYILGSRVSVRYRLRLKLKSHPAEFKIACFVWSKRKSPEPTSVGIWQVIITKKLLWLLVYSAAVSYYAENIGLL